MRVCILALANPFFWTRHYVEAFRQCAEVLTVGPPFGPEFLGVFQTDRMPEWARPNDIEAHLEGADLAQLLPGGWEPDLIVAVSDFGRPLNPVMHRIPCPKAYLSIDTWQCPRDYIDARNYDFVFVAQREFVPRLRATGSRNVHWLPLGCNPAVHYPARVAKTSDIAFVGSLAADVHDERRRLIEVLQRRFSVRSYERVFGDALCRACCRGRFVFNHSAVFDLNMRVFEALAMRSVLLTNRDSERNGLLDLFEDGRHLLVYDSEEHLISLVERYVNDEAARERIAQAGFDEVLAKHTYAHRVRTLLSVVGDQVAGFDAPRSSPPRTGLELIDYLPPDAGVAVDLGMSLIRHTDALRKRGVRTIIGIAPDTAKGGSAWDETCKWPGDGPYPESVDAVMIETVDGLADDLESVFRFAYRLLGEGGILLFKFSAPEITRWGLPRQPEAFGPWLRKLDFHLLNVHVIAPDDFGNPGRLIFNARKRTRTLAAVVNEGLSGLPFESRALRDFVAQLPDGV